MWVFAYSTPVYTLNSVRYIRERNKSFPIVAQIVMLALTRPIYHFGLTFGLSFHCLALSAMASPTESLTFKGPYAILNLDLMTVLIDAVKDTPKSQAFIRTATHRLTLFVQRHLAP
jgi:hypothetical protein